MAKSSGVSLAQLSRLEAGQVQRPSIETLIALAAALDYHPTILLVLGGHLQGEAARSELQRMFESAADYFARELGSEEHARLLDEVGRAETDKDFKGLAHIAFTMPAAAVASPAVFASVMPATAPDADLLRQVVTAWPELTPDRRWRLVELVRDMRQASQTNPRRDTGQRHKEDDDE